MWKFEGIEEKKCFWRKSNSKRSNWNVVAVEGVVFFLSIKEMVYNSGILVLLKKFYISFQNKMRLQKFYFILPDSKRKGCSLFKQPGGK